MCQAPRRGSAAPVGARLTGAGRPLPVGAGKRATRIEFRFMAFFGHGRKPEHQCGVVYVYLKKDDMPPYYSAVCRCGWLAEPVEAGYPDYVVEQQMASAAQEHDLAADISVGFPLDKPPGV
jgi:hypothetical protein